MTPSGDASSAGQQKSRVADCRGARALETGVTAAAAATPSMVRVVRMVEVLVSIEKEVSHRWYGLPYRDESIAYFIMSIGMG
jgi:hypothetical protein